MDVNAEHEVASPVALACVPGAIPASERGAHFDLITHLFGNAVRERCAIQDGYAFRFEAEALVDVARFVSSERRCCPFLTFTPEVSPGGSPLWLRLSGPPGSREFLDAELLQRRPTPPNSQVE